MEIIRFNRNNLPEKKENLTLILGNFDGFHRGHQHLCMEARINASNETGILLFDTDSDSFIGGRKEFLSSLDDKIVASRTNQLDYVYVLEVDKQFFNLTAEEFIKEILMNLGTSTVVVGEDYTFGKDRTGSPTLLKEYFKVVEDKLITDKDGNKISSTNIINLIKNGKIERACIDLGHKYEIKGKVVEGLHNGRNIGFRTINVKPSFNYVLPKDGVYYGLCYVNGFPYNSLINVGKNPTVGVLNESIIEAHLINFPEMDIYGRTVYVQFIKFRREEQKFGSLDELKSQIELDFEEFSLE